jgi:hypothetical protein
MYICTSHTPRSCNMLHKGLYTDFQLVIGIQFRQKEQNIKKEVHNINAKWRGYVCLLFLNSVIT